MTPQELRYSILGDAFTGKLCKHTESQDFGGIKIIELLETPFDVPDTWRWSTLGLCCEMYTGNSISETVKATKYAGLKTGYDYIATKDVTFHQEICYENGVRIPYDEGFKEKLFSLMNSIQELLSKGGTKVFTRYNVNIGDALWNALFSYVEKTFPDGNNDNCSIYRIDSICEEGGQKFAILQHRNDSKYYRLNFEFNAESTDLILEDATLIEITSSYNASTEPQFSIEEVEAYEIEYKKNSDKKGEEEEKKTDDKSEGEEKKCPKCGKPEKECTCEEEPEKKYSLEEIPEYVELQTQYSDLETRFNALQVDYNTLQATVNSLSEFKAKVEKKDKEAMIAQFYMLSDEDKKDVIDNIDTYSLEDIESKLSVICVRNKVSFDNENNEEKGKATTTFTLETEEDETMPAWVKRAMSVAKTLK